MRLDSLIPIALTLAPFFLLIGIAHRAKRWLRTRTKRSPLTRGLLRPPANTLRDQVESLRWDMGAYVALTPLVPLSLYAAHLQKELTTGGPTRGTWVFWLAGIGITAFFAWQLIKMMRRLRDLQLGMEAELAAAEELNQLMREGYWVFHDVPGEKHFNIDHVVVGPTGVFAIETKGRPKRSRDEANGYKVLYDGTALVFPAWRETKPLEQARLNAEWLRKWLTSAVGEPVSAHPVLMLPGWYVDRKSGASPMVINAKEAFSAIRRHPGGAPAEKLLKQIVHQLDQRCRDVEPKSYARVPVTT